MSNKTLTRCLGLFITACLAVPSIASAQQLEYRLVSAKKWEYRDLLKVVEIKSPYPETKPSEPKVETKPSEQKAETNPPEPAKPSSKPAETTDIRQLPTFDWRSTRWHMTRDQVAASGRHITPTTTSERRDHSSTGVGVALLKGKYIAQDIQYTAFYWFHDNNLIAVAIKPSDSRQWSKVNAALEQSYGSPRDDKSQTVSSGSMRCVVTDRKWISENDGNAIKFLAQDCNQNEHLNFYSVRYEPIPATIEAGLQVTRF